MFIFATLGFIITSLVTYDTCQIWGCMGGDDHYDLSSAKGRVKQTG